MYPAPVNSLLTYGNAWTTEPWPDYLALGFTPAHIPDLIRMATDDALLDDTSDDLKTWAPGHAWRALAQLQASEAAAPLTQLFRRIDEEDNDFIAEDLVEAFGVIGPGAIPALAAYLADAAHGLWARVAAAHSLEEVGTHHPAAREQCAAVLASQLERFQEQDDALNGSLVANLVALKAVEAAPVIERAFRADLVDEMVIGDWEDVQVDLGLKTERTTARRPPRPDTPQAALQELVAALERPRPQPTPPAQIVAQAERAAREASPPAAPPGPKRKHHRKPKSANR